MLAPVIVIATFEFSRMIISEASLSFLGLGVRPGVPSWGAMLADGRQYLATAWWVATFPGLGITVTVLAINLVGDWLRDQLDPRLNPGSHRTEVPGESVLVSLRIASPAGAAAAMAPPFTQRSVKATDEGLRLADALTDIWTSPVATAISPWTWIVSPCSLCVVS